MKHPPIPTTARRPVEYIPTPQDADRLKRERSPALQALADQSDAARRRSREGLPDAAPGHEPWAGDAAKYAQRYREAAALLAADVGAMTAAYPTPMRFYLSVPTSIERDQIAARQISLGLTQVTQEMSRAMMIQELFEQDWGKGSPEANEVYAEEVANFLDSYWQRSEAHDIAIARWQEQEVERALDEGAGAPPRPRADAPPKIVSVRETARVTLLVDDMISRSQKLRDMQAKAQDYNRRNALLLVRMHVVGADNVATSIEQDPRTGALPEAQAEALREEMDDRSWNDLVAFIDRMYRLDGYEEKNSDSPPVNTSDQTGSTERSGDLASSDGSSTISSTTPAPDGESAPITEPSLRYMSAGAPDPAMRPSNSPMVDL